MSRILIVDDEPNICSVWQWTLESEGYTADIVTDGAQALEVLQESEYDLILLDLYMEPVSGLDVLKSVRQNDQEVVVIILTGHGSMESAVEALRLGAFDYIFKPATPDVVRQRVREGLRHHQQAVSRQHLVQQIETLRQTLDSLEVESKLSAPPEAQQRFIHSGKLVIDCYHREATFNGALLDLTTTEFNLLFSLVSASPESVSPGALANAAMGYESDDMQARDLVKWHIYQLRRKIEPDPSKPQYIKNVRYKGYLWVGH